MSARSCEAMPSAMPSSTHSPAWRSPVRTTTETAMATSSAPATSTRAPFHRGAAVARRANAHQQLLTGWRGELLEDPIGVELAAAVRAPVDQHVVARAEVHREVALDRVPLVVGADELVELVEPPRGGDRAPAPRELVVVALAAQRVVGARQVAPLARDARLDLHE